MVKVIRFFMYGLLAAALTLITMLLISLPAAAKPNGKTNSKVTICHATSSTTNPYIQIVVSENAIKGHFDNPGTPKAGHEDDLLYKGEADCPIPKDEQPVDEDTPTEDPAPVTPAPSPVPTPSALPETPAAPVSLPSVGPDGR